MGVIMKKIILTIMLCVSCFSNISIGQIGNFLPAEKMNALKSDDPITRYHAVRELKSEAEIPEEVVDLLIKYLSDVRGEYPGNTIAGAAAEVFARYPKHAIQALPELMKLLAYTEKYAMPSGSAAEAIRAVKRVDLEAYLANLNRKKRLELSKSLLPVLENGIGSLEGLATISMLLGMLGEDVAITALESTFAYAKKNEADNLYFKEIRIRAGAALNILKRRWKIREASYLNEMKAADAQLGKPDQYVSIVDLFPQALQILSIKMKGSGAKAAYLIRKDKIPFDSISNGIPMARLAVKGKWFYLYTRPYMELSIPCRTRMVVLTSVSKRAYAEDYLSGGGMQPSYFPKTSDYAFIEMGANGPPLLDNALKSLLIKEGFAQDTWYEFWPEEWWDGAAKSLGSPLKQGKKLVWVKVEVGKIVGSVREKVE
jgi:hypothetical protein